MGRDVLLDETSQAVTVPGTLVKTGGAQMI
jgi:hypothetical protein